MKTILLILIAPLALVFPMNVQAQADRPSDPGTSTGWKPLFDGRSLDGWEHVGPGRFVVDNGMLRTEGGMGLLWYSREKLGNCVLRVVYKTASPRPIPASTSGSPTGPRMSGTPSTTATKCRSWTRPRGLAAPARSTRLPRPRHGRPKPASGTPWRSPSKGTECSPRSMASRSPNSTPAARSPSARISRPTATRNAALDLSRASSACRITIRIPSSSSRKSRCGPYRRAPLELNKHGDNSFAAALDED